MPERTSPNRTANFHNARSAYWNAKRNGKPQVAANSLLSAIRVGTAEEVAAFVIEVQRDMGKQDPDLIPADANYRLQTKDRMLGYDNEDGATWYEVSRDTLVKNLQTDVYATFRISFASRDHYGTQIFLTETDGTEHRVFSTDWALTESYLSS